MKGWMRNRRSCLIHGDFSENKRMCNTADGILPWSWYRPDHHWFHDLISKTFSKVPLRFCCSCSAKWNETAAGSWNYVAGGVRNVFFGPPRRRTTWSSVASKRQDVEITSTAVEKVLGLSHIERMSRRKHVLLHVKSIHVLEQLYPTSAHSKYNV